MKDLYLFLVLGGGGIALNLLMVYLLRKGFFLPGPGFAKTLGNRGEAGTKEGETGSGGVKFDELQQKEVNRIVQDRLAREREKYSDYEAKTKRLEEYERQNSEKAQKDLEAAKNYEEAKKTYEQKVAEREKMLSQKDMEIADLKISNSLTNEINTQGAFAEETIALLKSSAFINKDGQVKIKGKDANAVDVEYSVSEGVKKFLETRPHLVRSNFKSGSGSKGGDSAGSSGAGQSDISTLNAELIKAMNSGDRKKSAEIKSKINAHYAGAGIALR